MPAQVVPLSRSRSRRRPGRDPAVADPSVSTGPPVSAARFRAVSAARSTAVVHQQFVATAIGFLVAERRCTPQLALVALLEVVARTDRPLFDVAYRLVARHTHIHEGLAGLVVGAADTPQGPRKLHAATPPRLHSCATAVDLRRSAGVG